MMSLATIREMSREAAEEAAANNKVPFLVESEDIEDWKQRPRFPFPQLGDYVPDGWERVTDEKGDNVEYFVDSSGMGASDEPAMTAEQFVNVLEPGFGYAITDAGQFQLYVGKYRRV